MSERKNKRIISAAKNPQRTLLQQYEQLDPITKQAFNETFLVNLESAKYNMGQLIQMHINKEDSKKAMNNIFPPQSYGIGSRG
mmetsp:Transcript_42787/g.41131  ORF Transcript_42787/g.41131 Transcript_42787/m.41131 type:complete len:83 (-) Transcript_42787:670-918(-)